MTPRRRLLLASVSAAAMFATGAAGAATPAVFTPAWFAARGAVRSSAAALAQASGAMAGAARAAQTASDLARMALIIRQTAGAQAAARAAAAQAAAAIPDGLAAGGLQVASTAASDGSLWTGAALPVQSAPTGGRIGVRVTQTSSAALLTWTTLNVGAHTDLTFDQSAGGSGSSGWVVLNRVSDPTANPTQILGSISAPGHVLIINPNGIIFGAGSQTDVGALLASSVNPTQSDTLFLRDGIYGQQGTNAAGGLITLPSFAAHGRAAAVTVQPGAIIATAPPPTQGGVGGAVLLFGGAVLNAGSIDTPNGQAVLAAGSSFVLKPGQGSDPTATTLGTEVSVGGAGSVTNAGIVTASLGDITLVGRNVTQGGVLLSSTSVGQRGTLHLLTDQTAAGATLSGTPDPAGTVTLTAGSLTAITLDTSGVTATDAQRVSLIAASDTLARNTGAPGFGTLADLLDESRVEITAGGAVEFAGNSLTVATGGQVAVSAGSKASPGRILVDTGATIDVAGDADALLPVAANAIQVNIQTTPLRDAPINRDSGALANQNVWIDQRDLVTVPGTVAGYGGNVYTAGGLLAIGSAVVSGNTADGSAGLLQTSGNIALQTHTIQEWAAVGGTITLFGNVIAAQTGAMLNLAGGGVTYAPGYVPQSWLIGTNGRLYNANTAPADIAYAGVFDGFVEQHPHWSIDLTFFNPLIAPSQLYEPGYTVGRDAGTLELQDAVATRPATGGSSTTIAPAVLFNGAIDAQTYVGTAQIAARNTALIDGYQQAQAAAPQPGALLIGQYSGLGAIENPPSIEVDIGASAGDADAITARSVITPAARRRVLLDAAALDGFGLGTLRIATAGRITVSQSLTLASGGTLTLLGARVDVAADLTARAGAVTIESSYFNGTATVPVVAQGKAALSLGAGATIDTRGEFVNAVLDPVDVAGEARLAGGRVSFLTEGGITLGQGSLIDVSAGLAYLPGGVARGAAGGSVTITGDLAPSGTTGAAPVLLAGTIQGYGYTGGGTLSVTALSVLIDAAATSAARGGLLLAPDFFSHGFSDYLIDGLHGVTVAAGTTIEPVEPVFQLSPATPFAPTGDAPADALQLVLPPLFFDNSVRGTMTQRQGVSLSLSAANGVTTQPATATSTHDVGPGGGSIDIKTGALIAVDPGQAVRLDAYDQLTVDGTIEAPSGAITLANSRIDQGTAYTPVQYKAGLSIWLGADSRLSTAGVAYLAQDFAGRPYGVVGAGGTIDLGAYAVDAAGDPLGVASEAAIVVRPGAVVDASGTTAIIDTLAGAPRAVGQQSSQPVAIDTGGGTIALSSAFGIYDEGTLRAAAGGPRAAGGTLAMVLQAPTFSQSYAFAADIPPSILLVPHTIQFVTAAAPLLPADAAPGQPIKPARVGEATIGTDQIAAGGFANLAMFSQDAFTLRPGVSLAVAGEILLAGGAIAQAGGRGSASIAADVLVLSGYSPPASPDGKLFLQIGDGVANPAASGTLSLSANLVDIENAVAFGAAGQLAKRYVLNAGTIVADPTSLVAISLPGYAHVAIDSAGDIRFGPASTLDAAQDLTLTAAQVYPETNAQAKIIAGRTLVFAGKGAAPPIPLSANGSLTAQAATLEQGGVLRAPQGDITLLGLNRAAGSDKTAPASITLEPGSITSVSADGALIPYGGTPDGLTYDYAGVAIGNATTPGDPTITLGNAQAQKQSITVDAGATIDISGGGELVGAGFLAGRGGSADVLAAPLLSFGPGTQGVTTQSLASTPVYAIVSGFIGAFAPVAPADSLYSPVALGQSITLASGAPGLPAGTYTLLPAYYALLPGGWRVQLNPTTHLVAGGTQSLADGSTLVLGTPGASATGASAPLADAVTLTPGAVVRQDGAYDETSFSAFETTRAAQQGLPRPAIVGDAKTLDLALSQPTAASLSFSFGGTLLGQPAPGDYGSTVAVQADADLDILAASGQPSRTADTVRAADLDALGAQRLVIGTVKVSTTLGGVPQVDVTSISDTEQAPTVEIEAGASLRAPEVFIVAGTFDHATNASGGALLIDAGATISSLGMGLPAYDSAAGYYYALPSFGEAVVAVSNGHLVLVTGTANAGDVSLRVDAGASLLAGGSLLLATSGGVAIDPTASFGARYLTLGAADINIGSASGLAAAGTNVPAGLLLTQTLVDQLLAGNPASGAPPLASLNLTANSSLNFFGTVSLSTVGGDGGAGLQQLVINTPAIYGFGSPGDVAAVATGTLYLSGIVNAETLTAAEGGSTSPGSSVLPGGTIAGGPGTGSGQLDLQAAAIVLGYGPDTQADDQTVADRLILGFSTVDLLGSASISANNRSSLAVYQAGPTTYGQAGTGGALNLVTPLLTGSAGSQLTLTTAGALSIAPPPGVPASTASSAGFGAEIDATAGSAVIATAIVLPSGSLALTTAGDIDVASGGRLDVSGPSVALFDQTRALPGGSVALESTGGGISLDAAAAIDIFGAAGGGTLSATALAGAVALDGTLLGDGGPGAPGGSLDLRAGSLADFAALEQRLAAGGVSGAQSIEIASGDLVVAGSLTASSVALTVDAGSLTVTGTIDASGPAPGSIVLAAAGNLTLAAGSVLDAQGGTLQVDGYGQPIAAENTGHVSLTVSDGGPANAGQGILTIAPGATIDLATPDGVARGVLTLSVPRTGQTATGLLASVPGPIVLSGAGTVLVDGFYTYAPTDALGSIVQDNGGTTPVSASGTLGLNQVDAINAAYMNALAPGGVPNAALQTSLAGLIGQPGFRLQPGVEIVSPSPTGALTIIGDLDLSGFRYGPQATGAGAGIPGALVIRAGGNLTFNGSVSDGFGAPLTPAGTINPDQLGWVLYTTLEPFGQMLVIPAGLPKPIRLGAGTTLPHGVDLALGYPVTLSPVAFSADTVLPQAAKLGSASEVGFGATYVFAAPWTATAPILDANQAVVFAAGQVIPAGTALNPGWTVGAGTVLPFAIGLASRTVWLATSSLYGLQGANGSGFNPTLAAKTGPLPAGAIIPAGAMINQGNNPPNSYPDFSSSYDLRPVVQGSQGVIEAAAPMLPAGAQSWSMSFVSGANLGSASPLAVQPASVLAAASGQAASAAGDLTLADLHYTTPQRGAAGATPSLSVVRTGTGVLNLIAGGAFNEDSLFGIYTAGTQSPGVAALTPLQGIGAHRYGAYVGNTTPYYPTGGGDVLVSAQGDLTGDIVNGANVDGSAAAPGYASELVSDWLRRGEPDAATGGNAAWWINFGSYFFSSGGKPSLVGFSGIGTLGGGNLTIDAGGDIGTTGYAEPLDSGASQGLVAAIGATGRVTQVQTDGTTVLGGSLEQTGGGLLSISAGGAINPALVQGDVTGDLYGVVTDVDGAVSIAAAALGQTVLGYGADPLDPRAADPFVAEQAQGSGGLVLVPGDSSVIVTTRRDLVLQGVADPTRTPITSQGGGGNVTGSGVRADSFSLWQPDSGISLTAAGGNVAFGAASAQSLGNEAPTDARSVLPPTLSVLAAGGSLYFSGGELELAPSPSGQLDLLAGQSIYAAQQTLSQGELAGNISMSGAAVGPDELPNPFKPTTSTQLFAFALDTPTAPLHPQFQPQHVLARQGDIVGLTLGEVLDLGTNADRGASTLYLAASAADIQAGRDIVASGTPPTRVSTSSAFPNESGSLLFVGNGAAQSSGNLFLNDGPDDVSVVSAGRDILQSYFYVAGGGLLAVQAGRDLNQADDGGIRSIGPLFGINPSNHAQGAAIAVTVGQTPDYAAFAATYLNPANLADPAFMLASPQNAGRAAAIYTDPLLSFLQQYDGYTGDAAGALAAFGALPAAQQDSFLRQVFYAELVASGREETDPTSPRYHTYVRGERAIAALFPAASATAGAITMDSGTVLPNGVTLNGPDGAPVTFDAGISTRFGGAIDLLAPGGAVVLGTGAAIPGSNTGLVTFGSGDINVYAQGSVLLGQSRVFTTYGGNIDIWSAEGDISAGVGSKTSLIFSPPLLTYDLFGGVTEAPSTPSSGAGIASLAPLPGVPAGDVDLAAPSGTIDAGEAGIRVSGNLNLAAVSIANAANIQTGGKVTGAPVVQSANIGAITAAAAVSGAATNSATSNAARQSAAAASPGSVISVEVLDFGG